MTFRENINRICKERGTTLSAVTRSIGLSSSKVTAWNNGSLPKEDVMLELAHVLGCSVMDFFADEEDIAPVSTQTLNEDEEDILRVYRSLDRRAKHEFMAKVYDFENRQELEGDKSVSEGESGHSNKIAL